MKEKLTLINGTLGVRKLALLVVFAFGILLQNANAQCTLATTIAKVNPTCNGYCDGSLTANPKYGSGNYQYLWSNSETTKTITGLCAGTYTVTVTDQNTQCQVVKSATILKGKVAASFTKVNATCGQCNGSITVSGHGGNGGPFTYLWSTGATTATINNVCPNINYTITVYDKLGCTFVCHAKVTSVNTNCCPNITLTPTIDDNTNCGTDCNGAIAVTPSPGVVGDYNYVWNTGATTNSLNDLCAGTYTVTATDQAGCSKTGTYQVADDIANVSAQCSVLTNVSTNGGNDGSLTVSTTGAGPAYDWSNGATTQTITGLTAGNYTVTVTFDNGCTATSTCEITEPEPSDCDDDFTTYTQGGWHNNGQPGQYLLANFDNCAANFVLGDPCGYTITFTSAQEIQEFLPQGGTPAALTQSATDPGAGDITVLAGQVLANGLALLFDDCNDDFGGSDSYLGDQIYTDASSPFYGWSIQAIYDTARKALSGCPTNYSFSDLNDASTAINENYKEGGNNGDFTCPDDFSSRLGLTDAKQIAARPNPFTNSLYLDIASDENLTVTISDISGRTIEVYKNVTQSFEIQNNWIKGMYFITLQNEAGNYKQVLKVIRNE